MYILFIYIYIYIYKERGREGGREGGRERERERERRLQRRDALPGAALAPRERPRAPAAAEVSWALVGVVLGS